MNLFTERDVVFMQIKTAFEILLVLIENRKAGIETEQKLVGNSVVNFSVTIILMDFVVNNWKVVSHFDYFCSDVLHSNTIDYNVFVFSRFSMQSSKIR